MATYPNMNLTAWEEPTDYYNHDQLAANFFKIDNHNHTATKGVQIPTGGLAPASVTNAELAANAVTSAKILDGSILHTDIGSTEVWTANLADGAVTSAKIADGTIAVGDTAQAVWTTVHGVGTLAARPAAASTNDGYLYLATNDNGGTLYRSNGTAWVKASKGVSEAPSGAAGGDLTGTYPNPTLANNSVNAATIADGSVGNAELATNSVSSNKIIDGQVGAAELASAAVTTTKIADGNVTQAKLATNSVNNDKVVTRTLDVGKLLPHPAAHVRMTNDANGVGYHTINASAETILYWNIQDLDSSNMFVPDVNGRSPHLTAQWSGYYVADTGVRFAGGIANDEYVELSIYREPFNNIDPWEREALDRAPRTTLAYGDTFLRLTTPIMYLEAGQSLEVRVSSNKSGVTLAYGARYPYFAFRWASTV